MRRLKENRRPHERYTGCHLVEKWTNAKSALIGFHLGQHKSSVDVAAILRDGTSPETVRAMIRRWELPMQDAKRGVLVPLDAYRRKLLAKQAEKLGVSEEEFLLRISTCVLNDRLYDAVVDGRY